MITLAAVCEALTAVGAAFASFFGDETTTEGCETVENARSATAPLFGL